MIGIQGLFRNVKVLLHDVHGAIVRTTLENSTVEKRHDKRKTEKERKKERGLGFLFPQSSPTVAQPTSASWS